MILYLWFYTIISDIKNSQTRQIQNFLKFSSLFTSVKFNWCKGHNNILGNEMADFFAKESTLNPNCLLKELPLPISHLKSTVKAKSLSTWVNRWQKSTNGQVTHSFIPDSIPKHLISKMFSHKLTQVLTGHCKLNFFLNSIGKTLDPSCPCGKGIETVHHLSLGLSIRRSKSYEHHQKSMFFARDSLPTKK